MWFRFGMIGFDFLFFSRGGMPLCPRGWLINPVFNVYFDLLMTAWAQRHAHPTKPERGDLKLPVVPQHTTSLI